MLWSVEQNSYGQLRLETVTNKVAYEIVASGYPTCSTSPANAKDVTRTTSSATIDPMIDEICAIGTTTKPARYIHMQWEIIEPCYTVCDTKI
jgi:hypothetical protein